MRITESYGIRAAADARGHVVVIDVLRAFTTAAYALAAGASEILLVGAPEKALRLRAGDPSLFLAGEVGGRPIPGFDIGNSPAALERMIGAQALRGRRVALRSSSGVQGALAARAAEATWLGSLVTATATACSIAATSSGDVTLLAMGSPEGPDGPEDVACSSLLAGLLRGFPPDPEAVIRAVRESPAAAQALDPAIDWISPDDLRCATSIDRFDFAIRAAWSREGLLHARRFG